MTAEAEQDDLALYTQNWRTIGNDIRDEVKRAEGAFPLWPHGLSDAMMIVLEESGEAAQAAVDLRWGRGSVAALRKELVQEAAMCVRMIHSLDYRHITEAR